MGASFWTTQKVQERPREPLLFKIEAGDGGGVKVKNEWQIFNRPEENFRDDSAEK